MRPGDLGFLLSPVTVMMMVVMTVRLALDLGDIIALLCLGHLDHSFWHRLFWRARTGHRDVFASLNVWYTVIVIMFF